MEQGTINPRNGWKAYYAATKAIINLNAEFYNIIREGSLPAMSRFWLNADYVKCIHATGEFCTGYVLTSLRSIHSSNYSLVSNPSALQCGLWFSYKSVQSMIPMLLTLNARCLFGRE